MAVRLSLRDPLTGLANRRHFRSVIEREIDRVARSGETALLLMLDIDHFKQINDEHGHIAGDMVLQSVAQTLSGNHSPHGHAGALRRRGIRHSAAGLPRASAVPSPSACARPSKQLHCGVPGQC
jgi:GGDEF domain-containing protein